MQIVMKRRLKTAICFFSILVSGLLQSGVQQPVKDDYEVTQCMAKSLDPWCRKYHVFNYPGGTPGGNTFLTGIRRVRHDPHEVYISGFYECPNSPCVLPFVYKGHLSGSGVWSILNYPSSPGFTVTSTHLYGPNNKDESDIQVVGNYFTEEAGQSAIGCLYEGSLDGSGTWTTLIPLVEDDTVINTIARSTMGGLVVGNYDTQHLAGQAFIYDIKHQGYFSITKAGAISITANGIWHNGGDSYTICGGFTDVNDIVGFESGYVVDWNNKTRKLHNWRTYHYNNDAAGSIITHFNGITSDGDGDIMYQVFGQGQQMAQGLAFLVILRGKKLNGRLFHTYIS